MMEKEKKELIDILVNACNCNVILVERELRSNRELGEWLTKFKRGSNEKRKN